MVAYMLRIHLFENFSTTPATWQLRKNVKFSLRKSTVVMCRHVKTKGNSENVDLDSDCVTRNDIIYHGCVTKLNSPLIFILVLHALNNRFIR